jgi:8-oxo-dGTP pyrophosphatase MutT (NUDIX family)
MKTLSDYISKPISAGVIFVCPSGILMCHPTGKSKGYHNWDLPKGHIDVNETPKETAIREVREETGIKITNEDHLIDLGEFYYNKYKDIHLFKYVMDEDIDTTKCKCTSLFINDHGKEVPEMDGYMISKDLKYLYDSYKAIFKKIQIL